MKKVLTLKKFAYLFIATMAKQTPIIQLRHENKDILVCRLPVNYKQNIQNIMCEPNGWAEKFSTLIDVEEYFEDHFSWELQLSQAIKEVLEKLKKEYSYSFEDDSIRIRFSKNEISAILNKFSIQDRENMGHFARLVGDFIYTREYQVKYHDNNAKSMKFMHELYEKKYRENQAFENFLKEKKEKSYGSNEKIK